MTPDPDAIRQAVLAHAGPRAIYNLCREAPPADDRPRNFRWLIFDAGHYPKIRDAYRGTYTDFAPDSLCAAAWLAGRGE